MARACSYAMRDTHDRRLWTALEHAGRPQRRHGTVQPPRFCDPPDLPSHEEDHGQVGRADRTPARRRLPTTGWGASPRRRVWAVHTRSPTAHERRPNPNASPTRAALRPAEPTISQRGFRHSGGALKPPSPLVALEMATPMFAKAPTGSRMPLTWSISCHDVRTAASAGPVQGGPFRRRSLHGPDCRDRHPGIAPAGSRGPDADLADSADPGGRASGDDHSRDVVGPRPQPSPSPCPDRIADDRGDGDDLRHGLGTGTRDRPGPHRPGHVGGDRLVVPGGCAGVDPGLSGRRRGTGRSPMGPVPGADTRGARPGAPRGHRHRVSRIGRCVRR